MDRIIEYIQDPKNNIFVSNPKGVAKKLESLFRYGGEGLHLISDFDMTMTRYWVDGKRSISSHGVLERYSRTSVDFKAKTKELYETYYPKEISQTLSYKEKFQSMVEWWSKAHDLIIQQGMTREDLAKMVQENSVHFRPGLQEMIATCRDRQIPLLVFSAGIKGIHWIISLNEILNLKLM
jgi:5'-nucleotidase